jgi:hypothetical protein
VNEESDANSAIANEAQEIMGAIGTYAEAYAGIQIWQDKSKLIPKGDQKTGCIAEFYATLHLKSKYTDATLTNGHHSEKGWDIEVSRPERTWRVQVKAVSSFSEKGKMSPIKQGWDELFVFRLGRDFRPLGFWVINSSAIKTEKWPLKDRKCPTLNVRSSGSCDIPFGENRVEELRSSVAKFVQIEPSLTDQATILRKTEQKPVRI